jgi:hypothetical protein
MADGANSKWRFDGLRAIFFNGTLHRFTSQEMIKALRMNGTDKAFGFGGGHWRSL